MSALTQVRHTACRTHIDRVTALIAEMHITAEQAAEIVLACHQAMPCSERARTNADLGEIAGQMEVECEIFTEVAA